LNPEKYSRKQVSTYFGELVFDLEKIRDLIPKEVFSKLQNAIENKKPLDPEVAPFIAQAMKEWALSMGATHFAHWFQPYTGSTAEKHQAFITKLSTKTIENFTAHELVQGEPDASSFPSGGRRTTFEARGYTIWDPSSPAFLLEGKYNNTLAIPSVFLSFNGLPLDCKTPLLKSEQVITGKVEELLEFFNIREKVDVFVGAEQEFFLLDRKKLEQRYDLLVTGRTLIGADSPCEHLTGAHYFGSINKKVLDFMQELEIELYRLGIPIKTRHNEVAPNQFEMAPYYESANLAVDHNHLLMDMTRKIAAENGLVAVFYEKPFKGVNGNGKHLNWSVATKNGKNLLKPGKSEEYDMIFVLLLISFLEGINKYGHLLMSVVTSDGNELRLGIDEAPPAIISVFLGKQLSDFLDSLIYDSKSLKTSKGKVIHENIHLPPIDMDTSDRNRTSPIAFTGNKFEFRSPGGSQSLSPPLIFLNTIVAYGLEKILIDLKKKTKKLDLKEAVWSIVKKYAKRTRRIRFEGNAYSENWKTMAIERKLKDLGKPHYGYKFLVEKECVELMEGMKVYSHEELAAQSEIFHETYYRKILTQAKLLIDMVNTGVYPALVKQFNIEKEINSGIMSKERYDNVFRLVENLILGIEKLKREVEKVDSLNSSYEKSEFVSEILRPEMEALRQISDEVECIVDAKLWPFPRYRDLFLTHNL